MLKRSPAQTVLIGTGSTAGWAVTGRTAIIPEGAELEGAKMEYKVVDDELMVTDAAQQKIWRGKPEDFTVQWASSRTAQQR